MAKRKNGRTDAAATSPAGGRSSLRASADSMIEPEPERKGDQGLLSLLIKLAIDDEFRRKFAESPDAAMNDVVGLSDESKDLVRTRQSDGIAKALNMSPAQLAVGDIVAILDAKSSVRSPDAKLSVRSAEASQGTMPRRRVRIEVEFDD